MSQARPDALPPFVFCLFLCLLFSLNLFISTWPSDDLSWIRWDNLSWISALNCVCDSEGSHWKSRRILLQFFLWYCVCMCVHAHTFAYAHLSRIRVVHEPSQSHCTQYRTAESCVAIRGEIICILGMKYHCSGTCWFTYFVMQNRQISQGALFL